MHCVNTIEHHTDVALTFPRCDDLRAAQGTEFAAAAPHVCLPQ